MFISLQVFNPNTRRVSEHRIRADAVVQIGPVIEQPGQDKDHALTLYHVRFLTLINGRGLYVVDSTALADLAANVTR